MDEKPKRPLAPLVVLSLVVLINDMDLSILRGVLPLLEEEWGLSDFELGLLGFAYIFVHTLAAIPAGWVADNYRRTRIIGWTLFSWSVLSAFSAVAINYINLLVARASLGIGQAIDDPASSSLLSDYYPPERRGRVFSWITVASFIGSAFGLGLGGFIGAQLGWRWAFALVGMPGSLIAFFVFRLREARRGEADGVVLAEPEKRDKSQSIGSFLKMASGQLAREIKTIFGIRTMRYILIGVGALLFTVSGVGYWLAIYHQRYSGMTVTQSAVITAVVLGIGGIAGTIWGGRIADRVYGRIRGGRIVVVSIGILACTGLFLISYNVPMIPIRIVIQTIGVFAIASAVPGIRASMMDVLPVRSRGMGTSAFALVSALFGTALAPPLVGLISDMTSLLAAFYIVTPPIAVGALILLKARDTIEEDARTIIAAYMQQTQAAEENPAPTRAAGDGTSPLAGSEVIESDPASAEPTSETAEKSPK